MSSEPATTIETEVEYDFGARVDALRCRSTKSLRMVVAGARREQQRWYLEELAATRVLDDRRALDVVPDSTISARTAKTNREVARSLESLPKIAAAAWGGALSKDQLVPTTEVATPATDAEWAERGRSMAPVDLQRQARAARTVTAADAEARRAARSVTSWRDAEQGMAWDSLAHRKADAFVELATKYADVQATKRAKPLIVVRLCPRHHHRMEPHGTERLVGDPDLPDGLRVIEVAKHARAGPAP